LSTKRAGLDGLAQRVRQVLVAVLISDAVFDAGPCRRLPLSVPSGPYTLRCLDQRLVPKPALFSSWRECWPSLFGIRFEVLR